MKEKQEIKPMEMDTGINARTQSFVMGAWSDGEEEQ